MRHKPHFRPATPWERQNYGARWALLSGKGGVFYGATWQEAWYARTGRRSELTKLARKKLS